ncbi:hypothetical protein BDD12DRAFT_932102 [Trichophaea hybrida]|nr:hypothetical protein BDD12DRAFT_932102 [Trichophaea hybrida]
MTTFLSGISTKSSVSGVVGSDILSKIGWYESSSTVTTTFITVLRTPPTNSSNVTSSLTLPAITSVDPTSLDINGSSSRSVPSPSGNPNILPSITLTGASTVITSGIKNGSNPTTSPTQARPIYGNQTTGATYMSTPNTNSPPFNPKISSPDNISDSFTFVGGSGTTMPTNNSPTITAPAGEVASLAHRVNADGKHAMAFWVAISAVFIMEVGANLPSWV